MSKNHRLTLLAFCLASGACLSILLGQDASWDLRNYHLYNPYALLHDRLSLDFFPADKQTTNNPLLDLPYAFLAMGPLANFPYILAGFMGLSYGLLVFFTWLLAEKLFAHLSSKNRHLFVALGVLTSATGAIDISQAGSSSGDVTIGMLVLAGFFFILPTANKWHWKSITLGGLLFGLAAGLKLTAGIYALPLVLALLTVLPLREGVRVSGIFSLGWLIGFIATYGWWGWFLWQKFANPFFPLFNGVFHSPLAPADNLRDVRFLPDGLWQWLFYPFTWAFDSERHPVYETSFCDPRIAMAWVALIVLAAVQLRQLATHNKDRKTFDAAQKIALSFFLFSYLAWIGTTSILRYAVPVETLSVLVVICVALRILQTFPEKIVLSLTAVLCLVCFVTTRYPVWERHPIQDTMFNVDASWVEDNTLFVGLYEPMGYLAAFVPPEKQARFVGLAFAKYLGDTPLGQQALRMIHDHHGPIVVLLEEPKRPFLPMLAEFGLSPNVTDCHAINSNLGAAEDPPMLACQTVATDN